MPPPAAIDDDATPAAPTLWHAANKLPAATFPIMDCTPAAMEPATTPAVPKPTAPSTSGVAATAPAPRAAPMM